jgi:hypothetical protein
MQQTENINDSKAQIYLRAEPTEEGKEIIMEHRVFLDKQFDKLGVRHKLASRGDFHKTEIFLDSAFNWERFLKSVGVEIKLNSQDLLKLLDMPQGEREVTADIPAGYDIFLSKDGRFTTVMRLEPTAFQEKLIDTVKKNLVVWEKDGIIPAGSIEKMIASPKFPLARDLYGHKPHITLLKGKIKNVNIRAVAEKVTKELVACSLVAIPFEHIDIRTVRSIRVVEKYA